MNVSYMDIFPESKFVPLVHNIDFLTNVISTDFKFPGLPRVFDHQLLTDQEKRIFFFRYFP